MLRKLVKLTGVKVPLEKLPLPEMLYFWAAAEGPTVLTTPDYNVQPVFSSPTTLVGFYERSLKGVQVVGGPQDGQQKEFKAATLDTVHDLKVLFEMAATSEYQVKYVTVDPPGPDENFETSALDRFLAYALERSEKLYWEGKITRSDGSVIRRS